MRGARATSENYSAPGREQTFFIENVMIFFYHSQAISEMTQNNAFKLNLAISVVYVQHLKCKRWLSMAYRSSASHTSYKINGVNRSCIVSFDRHLHFAFSAFLIVVVVIFDAASNSCEHFKYNYFVEMILAFLLLSHCSHLSSPMANHIIITIISSVSLKSHRGFHYRTRAFLFHLIFVSDSPP